MEINNFKVNVVGFLNHEIQVKKLNDQIEEIKKKAEKTPLSWNALISLKKLEEERDNQDALSMKYALELHSFLPKNTWIETGVQNIIIRNDVNEYDRWSIEYKGEYVKEETWSV
ncbi:MAG: hypothetical protein R2799_14330 [Crocinitomicaceae bacterium]